MWMHIKNDSLNFDRNARKYHKSKDKKFFLLFVLISSIFAAGCQNTTLADLAEIIRGSNVPAPTGDTTPPAAPSSPLLASTDDTGTFNSDGITNQTTALTFTGTAEPDSTVELWIDSNASGATVVASGGTYSIDTDLAAGATYAITAKATDSSGNTSAASTILNVIVDNSIAAPTPPDLATVDDLGSSSADNLTSKTTGLTFSGTAETNSRVQLYQNNVAIGSSVMTSGNNYSIDVSILSDGIYSITAIATDLAGNVSSSSITTSLEINTTPPGAYASGTNGAADPHLNSAFDTGISNSDAITNVSSGLVFNGSLGTTNPGATVEIFIGGVLAGTAVTDSAGNYSIGPTGTVASGAITFVISTPSGMETPAISAGSIIIDTITPVYVAGINGAVNPALNAASDTGTSSTDGITNLNTGLIFSGSLGTTNPGAIVDVYVGGTLVGTAVSDGSGNYSVGPSGAISSGAVTFVVSDVAGNTTSTINAGSITVDTTAPSLSIVTFASNNAVPFVAKTGDIVTIHFESPEFLAATPAVTIVSNNASVSGSGTTWDATYTLGSGSETEGELTFAINFSDIAGNTGIAVIATTDSSSVFYHQNLPIINSAVLAASNGYLDITFSEGMYHSGGTPLLSTDLTLVYTQGGGTAAGVSILSVKKPDATNSASASNLAGGEFLIRVFLTITGTPNGSETIEIFTKDGTSAVSAYDVAGNGALVTTSTGAKLLNPASTVQFSIASSLGGEGDIDNVVNFQLSLSPANTSGITVNYTISGTGTNPATGGNVDYVNSSSVVIPSGNATFDIPITIKGDTLDEYNETFIVTLSEGSGYMIGAQNTHTYTITDDDAMPTVQFTAANQSSVDELNSSVMTITAQLSAVSGRDVSVPFTLGGTANLNTDYSISSSPITIPAGSPPEQNITITIIGDSTDEENETVVVTMGSPTNATASGTTVHTATITDDDASPTVSINNVSQNEGNSGNTSFVFTVSLSAASGRIISVDYATADNTATVADSDYTAISATTLTFTPGQISKTVNVNVNGDTTNESDESFFVNLTSLVNLAGAGNDTQGSGTILNDDSAVTSVAFASASSSGSESSSPVLFSINLSPAPSVDLTVTYSVSGSGANPATGGGTDFNGSTTVVIPNGSTSYNISVPVVNDSLDEFDEQFTVTLASDPDGATNGSYTVGAQATHVYTFADNDAVPQVSFSAATTATSNETSALNIVVSLSAVSGKNVTVDVNDTTPGGVQYATVTTDYTLTRTSGIQLTIPVGQTSANVVLTPVNDAIDETNGGVQAGEQVTMTLTNPANSTLGGITSHASTITDDDGQPNFSVADISGAESGNITMRISCVAFSCSGKSVNYATSNGSASSSSDYNAASGTAGAWSGSAPNWYQDIVITIIDDVVAESNETIIFSLSGNSAGTTISQSTAIITITNDDTSLVISSAETLDCNAGQNGKIDTYRITLSANVTDSTFNGYVLNSEGSVTSQWQIQGYNNIRLIHGTAVAVSGCGTDTPNDNVVYLRFDEGAATDTGVIPDLTASSATVSATSGAGKLYYNTGNVSSGDVVESDKAGPYIWKAEAFNTGNNNNAQTVAVNDKLIVYFTESTNAASLSGIDLDTVFTLNNGHVFGDAGDIASASWSQTANLNDTLTIIFASSFTGSPTIAEADTIFVAGTTISDSNANNPGSSMISMPSIIGAFDSGEKGPVIANAEYVDTNTNGRIDHVKVTFDLNIMDSTIDGYIDTNTLGAITTKWVVTGYNNVRIDPTYSADLDNDIVIYFKFDEGLDYDTGSKPDLTALASTVQDNDGISNCYINESITQCSVGGNGNGNVLTTTVNELDAAKPVFVSATARVGDRYIFVRFSENVWGQTGKPSCGSGGELIQDVGSSTFDFAYTNTNATGAAGVESVDGVDNCASSDAFVRLFADVVYISGDIGSDILKPYDGGSIFDAADNGMSATHVMTIQQTIAPYVVAASSFYDNGTQYGTAGFWLRIVFSEAMHFQRSVTASNYALSVQTAGTCSTIVGIPLSVRSISTTVYDLQSDAQCADTVYKITASNNIQDANEIEPVGSPNEATTNGTAATDMTKPKLLQALSLDSVSAQITYSEPMNIGALNSANYTITPSLGAITSVMATSDPSVFVIHHTDNQTGTFYTITAAASIADVSANTIQSVPGNQATFRGQGQVIQSVSDGPLFTNPFADGSSFSFAFGYNNKIYLGPNDTDSGAFRFEPDGANPLAISFYDTLSAITVFHAPTNPQADAISFFQSGSLTDQGDTTIKDFLYLVPVRSNNIDYFWFTTDIDSQLDFYPCLLGTSSGIDGGESIAVTSKYIYMGIIATGTKRPILRNYSFNMTTKTCTPGTATNTWNNNTQSIPALGDDMGNNITGPIGVDFIFVDGLTMFLGNNGGVAWATVNDSTGKPNLDTDFTALIDETGATCTAANVPTNWCAGSNRTLALNATAKVPSGRKGLPFMIKYNDGSSTAYFLARNLTTSFGGQIRSGGELWKCLTSVDCTNKTNWSRIFTTSTQGSGTGIENTNNKAISLLIVNGNELYVGFDNEADGARVYNTTVMPTSGSSFTEMGRIAGATASCTNHSGDTGALGGFCYGYQVLSFTSMPKQGYDYLYLTTGCKESTADNLLCDTNPAVGTFTAPPIRVLTDRD